MNNNLTEMVFIIDKSGSMAGLEDDTIGGYNSLLKKQKLVEGKAYVTTVFFDHNSKVVHDRVAITKVNALTPKDYLPGGSTALIDCLGDTIKHIGDIHKYIRSEDVPGKTVFVIITDGMENASHHYSHADVKKMINDKKKKYDWEFLFLGANIDAVSTAAEYGISAERAVRFTSDKVGTQLNYRCVSDSIATLRANEPLCADWKAEIEADHESRGHN